MPTSRPPGNRGAYLVNGLGHCGGCHTPKNFLGADESNHEFYGAPLDNWVASDLTGNERTGLGGWSTEDIAEYLANGRNARAGAGGEMGEVITYSTALMNDADRHAMAVYLKSLAPTSSRSTPEADMEAMRRGAAIYSDACASCHLDAGVGQPAILSAAGSQRDVAAGRSSRARARDSSRQPCRYESITPIAAHDAPVSPGSSRMRKSRTWRPSYATVGQSRRGDDRPRRTPCREP